MATGVTLSKSSRAFCCLADQFVEQGHGVLETEGVEALGEPAVDRGGVVRASKRRDIVPAASHRTIASSASAMGCRGD